MRLTPSVRIRGITPEMIVGVICVESAYREIDIDCVWTSGMDKKHSPGSLHYSGNAVDFRTKNVPRGMLDGLVQRCRKNLPTDFDVVLEFRDQENEHLHVEYQPKTA